ncbi:zinc finger CCCH domain-containing protein 7B-like [Osmerus mordax]|uniref:zinc finger CCCH domain-containing protein 7B-like n=1 Tax=Osmerus mordax TaxID=8014 RepID=UPI0035108091
MDSERQKRKNEIQKGLSFIRPSLPYPKPNSNEGVLTQLICNLLDEGNVSFREEQWDQAITNFTEGVNVAQYAQSKDLGIPPALLESLYVNRASTYHSMEKYERCIQDCDHALAVCKGSRRALYRKALCLKELGRYREAYNCSIGCLLTAPNDKQANELARELANRLGMRVRKAYVSSKEPAATESDSNGTTGHHMDKISANRMYSLRDIAPSTNYSQSGFSDTPPPARIPGRDGDTSLPAAGSMSSSRCVDSPGQGPQGLLHSGPEAPGDLDLIGDDLDTLLDSFSNELEATEASFPTEPCMFTSSPVQTYGLALPAPSPKLPPAFFTSAVSQLNSLDTFRPKGEDPSTAPSSLDSLDGLDALDNFPAHGGGGDGSALQPSLNALMEINALDSLDNLAPFLGSGAEAPPMAATGDELNDLDLEGLDFLNTPDSIPVLGDGGPPEMAVYPLNALDSLDSLDNFSPLEGASAPALTSKAVGGGRLVSPSEFTQSGGGRSLSAPPASRSTKSNYTNNHGGSVMSRLYQNPLASTHIFLQACFTCYISTGPGIFDVQHQPDLVHNCRRDILLCRSRAESLWMRVRARPIKTQVFGPYVLCKEILQSGLKKGCKYGEACMFAFCQQEIDVWTQERRGALSRGLLFGPPQTNPGSVPTIKHLLQLYNGMFIFLCKECYDSKPRIISKRSEEAPGVCSNLSAPHPFDGNKCLVHVVRSTSVSYSKIRPLHALCHHDVCRHAIRYGCQREDTCQFAHSVIELKFWMLQRDTGITPEEIVLESTKHWQKLEQNAHKQRGNKPVSVPQSRATGGARGGGGSKGLNMRMKFVCGQCWKDGLVSEPDKALKYCTAKARHSWTKERRVLLVMSLERKKWAMVRPLPYAKTFPQQYEICGHIAKQRKCTFTGNCTYAHSVDEKEVWTYMKNQNLKDMQQMYDMWMSLTSHDRQPDGAWLSQPPVCSEDKYIVMPTDFAEPMNGFHCRLCGRHSNGERQWQQHISSEKHKDRVFSCEGEDESLAWAYRFPGPHFTLCPRLESVCEDGVSCDYAHSEEELVEWKERRDFLRRKLAKAREDMLIMPNEFDFGKYNFLLQG